ncbi:spore germination protein [Paenibacillus sp. CAA11]|nr:spore germination protein [Paenibacillus sp. CAA11]
MPSDESNSSILQSGSVPEVLQFLRSQLGNSPDIILQELGDASHKLHRIAVCYVDGLVDTKLLSTLMRSLLSLSLEETLKNPQPEEWLKEHIPVSQISVVKSDGPLVQSILEGQTAVIIDGMKKAFTFSIPGGSRRSIEEPSTQTVIRGPKEGFTEEIGTNIALLRRRIRSPHLRFETRTLGQYTQTKVAVGYINGIANKDVVDEVMARLDRIDTDSILEGGYIEEFIQDGAYTPFPTIYNTERPDTVAAGMLEGLVAIIVDGTPFTLLAPVTFFRFFASSEDYYQRYDISSFLRLVRLVSFIVALMLPAVYIAITTFQQEMLPTTLLITLAAQREGTPLPALLEALVMELTFEVIREAGVRMPRAIGPAISIVGALVLGQAAVQAGLVSAAMVIVVSFTAISNFVLPAINMASAVRLLRFALMLLAGTLGLFGILVGLVPILVHLVSIRSFGVPYMVPLAPLDWSNMKDFIVRLPWWRMKTRPVIITKSRYRQAAHQEPRTQHIAEDENFDQLP